MTEGQSAPFRKQREALTLLIGFSATALIGLIATHVLDSSQAGLISAAAFAAVISAAMVISWGAEAGQFFISQGLAVALIALLQVMPEFMVEAVIAWHGEVRNMFANATGSNRLLIGLGWPLIYFTADISHRLKYGRSVGSIQLRRENIVEVTSLLVASSFYLKMLAFGSLTMTDGVVLCGMYLAYMYILSRLPEEESENKDDLLAAARYIVELPSPRTSKTILLGLFLIGGGVMAFVAEPFVESLKHVATSWGIREFVFIQWVAPFLSEFPEKVTAFYWSRTIRLAPLALLNMISSTVSQFTLLVGMIPLVYAASYWMGHFPSVHKDIFGLPLVPMMEEGPMAHDIRVEVFLSWAMTLLGCAMLAKLRFTWGNAVIIFAIWILQFVSGPIEQMTGVHQHIQHFGLGVACIALALFEVVRWWKEIEVRAALRETIALMRGTAHRTA